jgi:cellular nucleic acid-binding protein
MLVRPSKDLEHKLMKSGGSQSHLARDCTEAGPVGGGGSGYSAGGNGGSGWGSAGGNAYGGGGGGGGRECYRCGGQGHIAR